MQGGGGKGKGDSPSRENVAEEDLVDILRLDASTLDSTCRSSVSGGGVKDKGKGGTYP